MNFYQEALEIKDEILANRKHIHHNPEVGLELHQTADYVEQKLIEMGYEPKRVGECGLTCTVGRSGGKCFLLRADMDALPVKEDTGLPFAATNGRMHACGHDCHTASLLGAAKLLKVHEAELEGLVKFMFQPAEETMEGGKMMLDNGILENPKVDAALGMHVFTNMPQKPGTVIVTGANSRFAAVDWFTIRITGKTCHGAQPQKGVDALNVMTHIYLALQTINARELTPSDNLVLTIGQMHGGNTSNVIPGEAIMTGTIRTVKNETRAMVKSRMEQIVSMVASAFRAEAHVEYGAGCPVLAQDHEVYEDVKSYLHTMEGIEVYDRDVMGDSMLNMGSEDFAYTASAVPSVFLLVAAGQPEHGYCYPQHHPKADFHEDALPVGAATYAHVAMEWLRHHH